MKLWFFGVIAICFLLATLVVLFIRMEKEAPTVVLDGDAPIFGKEKELPITFSDDKSGLKKVWVGLFKDGREAVLLEKEYPASGWLQKGSVKHLPLDVLVKPKDLGFTDGEGILRLVVTDHSWRNWGKGNRTYMEKQVVIDTKSPRIEVLTDAHNISPKTNFYIQFGISLN